MCYDGTKHSQGTGVQTQIEKSDPARFHHVHFTVTTVTLNHFGVERKLKWFLKNYYFLILQPKLQDKSRRADTWVILHSVL